jgi:hypothetical protein
VIGIAVPMAVFIKPEGRYLGILLGALMVAALGLIDDIKGINATVKMVGIVAAALIPVVGFGMTWENVGLPLVGNFDLGWAAYPLTVFWIAALANLVNPDRRDGLPGVRNRRDRRGLVRDPRGVLRARDAAVLRRSSAAPRLRSSVTTTTRPEIFMGDTGALALGFLLACVAVQGVLKTAATIALARPAARDGGADPRHLVRIAEAAQVQTRAVAPPTRTTSTTASCASVSRSGGRRPTCISGRCCSPPMRSCCASSRRGRSVTGSSQHR